MSVRPRTALAPLLVPLLAACASAPAQDRPRPARPAAEAHEPARDPGPVSSEGAPPPDAPPLDERALGEAPTLEDYLALAAAKHPALAAARARWSAGLERVEQAEALPDPNFTYRYYIEEVQTRVGPQRQAFALRQPFPWFGELALRGDVAAGDAAVAGAHYDATRLAVLEEVQSAYAEHYFLARSIEVLRGNVELFRYLEGVLRERYGLGTARHPDVIRAQVELGKLTDRLRSLEDLRGASTARLRAAIGLRPGGELPWPTALERRGLTAPDEALLVRLLEQNPELAALEAQVAREESAIELAEKQFFPDLALGVETIDTGEAINPDTPGSGQDAWMVSLSIDLPVQRGRLRAGVREARARHHAALEAREDLANRLEARARRALFELRDAARKIELYRTSLIPKARESLRATEAGLGLGTGSFLDLVDAQRVLLEFELAYERALTDHLVRRAELERLVGGALAAPSVETTADEDATQTEGIEETER